MMHSAAYPLLTGCIRDVREHRRVLLLKRAEARLGLHKTPNDALLPAAAAQRCC
jgi:hypothetical protein